MQGDQKLRVKLFGLGSAGCNMIGSTPFSTVAFSTSNNDLERSRAERKIFMVQENLIGVSASNRTVLRHLPSVAGHDIVDVMNNTDMACLMCGLGGVSGSLGSKLFSAVASGRGIFNVACVAAPFSAESLRRREFANKAMKDLTETANICLAFDNDELSTLSPNMPLSRAFAVMNSIMLRPLIDLYAVLPRTDLAPLRSVVSGSPLGRFGLGLARGDERVARVVDEAMSSPWFNFDLSEAKAALAVYSAADPWEAESQKIVGNLGARLQNAKVTWGSYADPQLGDRIRLSVILCRRA
jgi:cell division protein FtsZ